MRKKIKFFFILLIIVSLIVPFLNISVNPSSFLCDASYVKLKSLEIGSRIIPETQANEITSDFQDYPCICRMNESTYVIAWQSNHNYHLNARVFNMNGTNMTSEFVLGGANSLSSDICRLNDTCFVAAYDISGNQEDIGAKIFDINGNNLTSEFVVNSYTTEMQQDPRIAALNETTFVIVWVSIGQDGDLSGIFGKVFDITGTNLTNDFPINSYTTSYQSAPAVSALDDTRFVVAWHSYGQDGNGYGVYACIFDIGGSPIWAEKKVNSINSGDQLYPSVCCLNDTHFMVAWSGEGFYDSGGVFAACIDIYRNTVITEFKINAYSPNAQYMPSISNLTSTSFIITWLSYLQDGSFSGVYASVFDLKDYIEILESWPAMVPEFLVNVYWIGNQRDAHVTAMDNETFIVVWESPQDGSNTGIYFSGFKIEPYTAPSSPPLIPGFNITFILLGFLFISIFIISFKHRSLSRVIKAKPSSSS